MKKILLGLCLLSTVAYSKCLVQPNQIEEVAQKIEWQDEEGQAQNTALIQSTAEGSLSGEDSATEIDYEAFIRPDADGVFQILPIPLFLIEMKHSRDSIYICAHIESEDEAKNEILIYFLRHGNIKTIIPKPIPFMSLKNFFWNNLRRTPLVLAAVPLQVYETLQNTAMNLISDITKVGVDRVRIKGRQIELYSGGDPAQFDTYVIKKVIDF